MLGLGSYLTQESFPSDVSSGETLIASYNFQNDTGTGTGSGTIPSGWERSTGGAYTIYGTTVDTSSASLPARGWQFTSGTTVTTNSGPGGGHVGGPDAIGFVVDPSSGTWASTNRYLYYEASSATSATSNYRSVIRTEELDFSGYSNITMTFWFHAYGDAFGGNVGGAVAVTTAAQSSSSADEAGTGLGLTSDTAGGATITYEDLGGTSHSVVRIGAGGQVQTSGHTSVLNSATNYYVKATCDLSAAAGQSSVYVHFVMITNAVAGTPYRQDLAIDSISIIGS